jgi:hypothetical protein
MTRLTVGDLKDNITEPDLALRRAVRNMLTQAYIPEAVGIMQLDLFDGVFDYESPESIFGGTFIDLRPQGVSRVDSNVANHERQEVFDRFKGRSSSGYMVAFEHRNGTPIMRVDQSFAKASVDIDTLQATTGWTLSGTGSNLIADTNNFYDSPASLRFTATGSGAAILTKAVTSQDLSDFEDVGVAFLAIRTPSVDNLTSIELKLGSASGAYNNVLVTEGFLGAWRLNDWILVAFDFSTASQTGSPAWNAIDYAQITVNHTATLTNFRVGALFMSMASPHELIYKTAAIFDNDGVLSNDVTDDTDEITLDDSGINLLEHQYAYEIAQQESGGEGDAKVKLLEDKLFKPETGLYSLYKAANPSEQKKVKGRYYRPAASTRNSQGRRIS